MSDAAKALKVIDALLAALALASEFQINWNRVKELQARADAEGRPLNAAERQELVDGMVGAVDQM